MLTTATMTFPTWIQHQADTIRSQDSSAADWLASKIEELATEAIVLQCDSPGEFEDREEALRGLYHGGNHK